MKQIKIAKAYITTEELSNTNLSINSKWVLYKLRKDLTSYYQFYVEESGKLFYEYDAAVNGDEITFKSAKDAKDYKEKQSKIDNFEVAFNLPKQTLKISDVPSITIQQIETLDEFIEFVPE